MQTISSTLSLLLLLLTALLLTTTTTVHANPTNSRLASRGGTTTRTCQECVSSPNNCDITAPCSSAFGQKLLCACRPGYRASNASPTDTSKQWRLNFPFHEYRVWVAPGVVCDTLCTNPFSGSPCSEVTMIQGCVAYP